MDLIRPASPSASTSSSLDSNGLPHCRINCNKRQILVGSQKFESATDALVAYLNQFDHSNGHSPVVSPACASPNGESNPLVGSLGVTANGQTGDRAVEPTGKGIIGSGLVMGPNGLLLEGNKEDVEKLLTSKVCPELKEEVTDTLREVKLRHLLKKAAMKSQKQTKTGLQQEVEAALARSAKLLEKVTREDIPSNKAAVSDISDASISTQALLAINGGSSDDSIVSLDSIDLKERKNGHIYSYHQSSLKSVQPPKSPTPPNPHRHSRHRERRSSVDSLLPPQLLPSPRVKASSDGSSNSLSNNSDPSDIIRRIRSRSVPPRLHKQRNQSPAHDWLGQLDRSVSKSVPSWVKSMSPSEVSDSVWLPKTFTLKTAVPSWVEEVDRLGNSNTLDTSAVDSLLGAPRLSRPYKKPEAADLSKHSQMYADLSYLSTESKPEFSYNDLDPNDFQTLNSAKHVTFEDSEVLNGPVNPVHSTPISKNLMKNKGRYSTTSVGPSKVMDSEFNGESYLRNNILPQTARLKRSMENFASSTENLRKSTSSNSSDASSDNKCSSLDTFALLTGRTVSKADIRASSSAVPKEKKIGSIMFPDSPAISSILPEGSQGRISNGHSSSDGLDGDRPWEAMTNTFKPPVPVRGDDDANPLDAVDAGVNKLSQHLSSSLSGGNQPGSMEALKNMLFKLQAEETSVQQESNTKSNNSNDPQSDSSPAVIPALQDYDFQMEPGGHSLEKALLHLNRLKTLVKTTGVSSKTEISAKEAQNNDEEKS